MTPSIFLSLFRREITTSSVPNIVFNDDKKLLFVKSVETLRAHLEEQSKVMQNLKRYAIGPRKHEPNNMGENYSFKSQVFMGKVQRNYS